MGSLAGGAGAAVIRFDGLTESYVLGFLVVQGANICFAIGQVGYKVLLAREKEQPPARRVRLLLSGGPGCRPARLAAAGHAAIPHQYPAVGHSVVAGDRRFRAWLLPVEQGATQVSSGVLAIMNNALIPAGLLVNLLLWGKDTDLLRLTLGGLLMLASLWVCQRHGVSER